MNINWNEQIAAFADEAGITLKTQINALKRNGLSKLEIRTVNARNITKLSMRRVEKIALSLETQGIKVSSIGSPIGKVSIRSSAVDEENRLKNIIEKAKILNAPRIRIFSFYKTEDEHEDEVLKRLDRFCSIAQGSGIQLCHENEKGIFGDTAQRCLTIAKNLPEMKLVFDPANFVQCGEDTIKAWELLSPYVDYLHIKDARFDGTVVPAGDGDGHLAEIVHSYLTNGGTLLSIEPHLANFKGFKGLETKSGEQIKGAKRLAPSKAFDYASHALRNILEKAE